jgi:hypothetical protein
VRVYSSDQYARLIDWRNRIDSRGAIVKLPSLMLVRHFKNFVRTPLLSATWSRSHFGNLNFLWQNLGTGPGGVARSPPPQVVTKFRGLAGIR